MNIKKINKILNFWYYGALVVAVLAALLGYFCCEKDWFVLDPMAHAGQAVYTILILYCIASIPLVLKQFGARTKKIDTTDAVEAERTYLLLARVRIAVIAAGLVLSIFFAYVMSFTPLLWLAGISAVALYFAKPTKEKIAVDLRIEVE